MPSCGSRVNFYNSYGLLVTLYLKDNKALAHQQNYEGFFISFGSSPVHYILKEKNFELGYLSVGTYIDNSGVLRVVGRLKSMCCFCGCAALKILASKILASVPAPPRSVGGNSHIYA